LNPNGRYVFNETEAKRRRLSLLGKVIFASKTSPTPTGGGDEGVTLLQEIELVSGCVMSGVSDRMVFY